MAFNIRNYLGITNPPGVINHDNDLHPIPDDLLDRLDRDVNELISYTVGAKASKAPTTAVEIEKDIGNFINSSGLSEFYPKGHPLLAEVSKKAEALINDKTATLNSPAQVQDRVKLALYDVVLYCDDSYSMQTGDRIQNQNQFVSRISEIITPLDDNGIKLRFINTVGSFDNLKSTAEVSKVMALAPYNSYTQIGTAMQSKILDPLFFGKLQAGSFAKPLLVIVITDGAPNVESPGHFKDVIMKCKDELKTRKLRSSAIQFQINQIGDEAEAEVFIQSLFEDKELKPFLHCTSEKLDAQIIQLKENSKGLDEWLLNLLTVFTKPKRKSKTKN